MARKLIVIAVIVAVAFAATNARTIKRYPPPQQAPLHVEAQPKVAALSAQDYSEVSAFMTGALEMLSVGPRDAASDCGWPAQPPAYRQISMITATALGQRAAFITQNISYDYETYLLITNDTRVLGAPSMTVTNDLYRVDLELHFTSTSSSCVSAAAATAPPFMPLGNCSYAGTTTVNGVTCDKFHFVQSSTDYIDYFFQENTYLLISISGVKYVSGMEVDLAGSLLFRDIGPVPDRDVTFAVPSICGTYGNPPAVPSSYYPQSSSPPVSSSSPEPINCAACVSAAYDCDTNGNCHCTMGEGEDCFNIDSETSGSGASATASVFLVASAMLLSLLAL